VREWAVLPDRTAVFAAVFRAVPDLFAAGFLAAVDAPADAVECVEEGAGDCAANQGTNSNSDSTPARRRNPRRAEKKEGATTIMFSL
jgi:hypothetical protein